MLIKHVSQLFGSYFQLSSAKDFPSITSGSEPIKQTWCKYLINFTISFARHFSSIQVRNCFHFPSVYSSHNITHRFIVFFPFPGRNFYFNSINSRKLHLQKPYTHVKTNDLELESPFQMQIQMWGFFWRYWFSPDSLCFFIYKAHEKKEEEIINFKTRALVLKEVISLIKKCRHMSWTLLCYFLA